MKFECVKKLVDMNIIKEKIFTYDGNIKYLIMNERTYKDIKNCCDLGYIASPVTYGTIYGVPIAICNQLADGWIDLMGEK